eukprot:GHVL01013861.1.p1 GENE.GHVL01013861.1~~GHVL01013861.1.p1  ORF type:complete len:547 (-),score=101.56 GHVL01013861.1:387-2027(-)
MHNYYNTQLVGQLSSRNYITSYGPVRHTPFTETNRNATGCLSACPPLPCVFYSKKESIGSIKYTSRELTGYEMITPTDTYRFEKLLHPTRFGSVYLTRNAKYFIFVVKIIEKSIYIQNTCEDPSAEVKFRNKMIHKNFMIYDEAFEDENNIYLLFEYAQGGDLSDAIKNLIGRNFLSEEECRNIFHQILEGCLFLHEGGVALRDISLENILLLTDITVIKPAIKTERVLIKITDPGQAVHFDRDSNGHVKKIARTMIFGKSFRPPEAYSSDYYDPTKIDSFCIGWMLFVALTGNHPFEQALSDDFYWKCILERNYNRLFYDKIANNLSARVQDLLVRLLEPDPDHRFSIFDAFNHSWFTDPPRPQIMNESPPRPQIINESSPRPQIMNESPPRPQIINESPPRPQIMNESHPRPQIMNESHPRPQIMNESPPRPQIMNESRPLDVNVGITNRVNRNSGLTECSLSFNAATFNKYEGYSSTQTTSRTLTTTASSDWIETDDQSETAKASHRRIPTYSSVSTEAQSANKSETQDVITDSLRSLDNTIA